MIAVAICYKTDLGPVIGFYEADSEEAAGKYTAKESERDDYIAHNWLPLKK
jgi:hypothetical protein